MWVECSEIIGRCLIGKHNLPRSPPTPSPSATSHLLHPAVLFQSLRLIFLRNLFFIVAIQKSNPIEKEAIIANPPFSCQFPPAAQKGNFRHILPRNICEKDNFPIICASAVVSAPADNAAIMCCWLFPEVHYPSARIRQCASVPVCQCQLPILPKSWAATVSATCPTYRGRNSRGICGGTTQELLHASGFYESHEWLYLCTPLRLTGHGAAYHCLP